MKIEQMLPLKLKVKSVMQYATQPKHAGSGIARMLLILLHVPKDWWGWSGGAMVLGKLPVPGRPTTLITVGQGPIALAVGAVGGGGGGVVWTFLL